MHILFLPYPLEIEIEIQVCSSKEKEKEIKFRLTTVDTEKAHIWNFQALKRKPIRIFQYLHSLAGFKVFSLVLEITGGKVFAARRTWTAILLQLISSNLTSYIHCILEIKTAAISWILLPYCPICSEFQLHHTEKALYSRKQLNFQIT